MRQKIFESPQTKLCNSILEQKTPQRTEVPSVPQPTLQLQVELENGQKVYIRPLPTDEPKKLATQFCQKHNLDCDMIDVLAESIKTSLRQSLQTHEKDNKKHQNWCTILEFQPKPPKPRRSSISPHSLSNKSSQACINLYERGKVQGQAHREWVDRQKQLKKRDELRECTHKPKINTELSRSKISEKNKSFQKEEKKQKHRTSVSQFQIEESIRKMSLYTNSNDVSASNVSKKQSIFDKLYQRKVSPSHSTILKEMTREETHHPNIDHLSKVIVGDVNFKERMLRYDRQSKKRKEALQRSQIAEKQNLHKPKIGLPPPSRNKEGLPIGDFLYQRKKSVKVMNPPQKSPKINNTSAALYQRKKYQTFQKIFDFLSNNTTILAWNSSLPEIEPHLFDILLPLLEEIEIMQIQLNKEDFNRAMNFLFSTLSPIDRHKLLNFDCKAPLKECNTFQPILNEHSREMVKHMSRCRMNIYDYCEVKETVRMKNLQSRRVEKERKQMRQCTFHPQIDRPSFYY